MSVLVGLFVAAVLNTWLAVDWVRGMATAAVGVYVTVGLARGVVATHVGPVRHGRSSERDPS